MHCFKNALKAPCSPTPVNLLLELLLSL